VGVFAGRPRSFSGDGGGGGGGGARNGLLGSHIILIMCISVRTAQ